MICDTQILLIRACKSVKPLKRLRSVYKRQYGKYPDMDQCLMEIMATLIDEHFPISSLTLVKELSYSSNYKYVGFTYFERVILIYINHFRYTNVETLCAIGCKFRKRIA